MTLEIMAMVNSPLIRPYFSGGGWHLEGVSLGSHDESWMLKKFDDLSNDMISNWKDKPPLPKANRT